MIKLAWDSGLVGVKWRPRLTHKKSRRGEINGLLIQTALADAGVRGVLLHRVNRMTDGFHLRNWTTQLLGMHAMTKHQWLCLNDE